MTNKPKHIIITGASSGIGRALALEYASPDIVLALTGRNERRLKEVAEECNRKGAKVDWFITDLSEYEVMSEWMCKFDYQYPVDLVISNAGISGGTDDKGTPETIEQIEKVFSVNVLAAIYTAHVLYERMRQRGKGQIAFTGSMAGFQGWAGAPAYTASKAALNTYAEALRMLSKQNNIKVNIITPGFVKTAMTEQNKFPMPFMVPADRAAKIIRSGLKKNKRYIIFPQRMYFLSLFSRALPECLVNIAAQHISGKKRLEK